MLSGALRDAQLHEMIDQRLHELRDHLVNRILLMLHDVLGLMVAVDCLHERVHRHAGV